MKDLHDGFQQSRSVQKQGALLRQLVDRLPLLAELLRVQLHRQGTGQKMAMVSKHKWTILMSFSPLTVLFDMTSGARQIVSLT